MPKRRRFAFAYSTASARYGEVCAGERRVRQSNARYISPVYFRYVVDVVVASSKVVVVRRRFVFVVIERIYGLPASPLQSHADKSDSGKKVCYRCPFKICYVLTHPVHIVQQVYIGAALERRRVARVEWS